MSSRRTLVPVRFLSPAIVGVIALSPMVAGAADDGQSTGALEEIIVTSRKVAENLQDVPISIVALTADALDRSNIVRVSDLTTMVPGLEFAQFNLGLPQYYIRGIGSENQSGGIDPSVGVFLDEVYVGRASGTSGDFLDIERIEVLRGPQGTLFGRNVVGGAIALFSKRPTHDFDWSAGLRVGNYERFDVEGMINGSISERVAGRLALSKRTYGGHSRNTLTGNDLDDQDRTSARGSLLISPTDSVEVLLRAEYGEDDARGQWWDLAVEGPFSVGNGNADRRSGDNPEDGYNRRRDWGLSAVVNWETSIGTLTSISAYRDSQYEARENTTSLVVLPLTDPNRFNEHHTLFIQQQHQYADQFSQELRLASELGDSLNLVTGLFYLDESVDRQPLVDYRFVFFNSEDRSGVDARSELESFAVFAQIQYSFAERWQVAAGARWTEDQRSIHSQTFGRHFAGYRDQGVQVPGWTVDEDASWSEVTPMASLSFFPRDGLHLYGTVSQGFKSGGFEDSSNERETVATPFEPELATNYEVGVKSELLDRRLRLNANLFYVDYTDLQLELISQPDPNLPPFGVSGNAGEAEIKGVEVDWEFAATSALTLFGGYAYNDNEVRDVLLDDEEISGNRLVFSPENQATLGVTWDIDTQVGTFQLQGDVSYQDEMFGDLANGEVTTIDSYTLYNASIGWTPANSGFEIELWGKNLSDKLYWTTASEVPVQDGYVKYGEPRTYGMSLSYRFKR